MLTAAALTTLLAGAALAPASKTTDPSMAAAEAIRPAALRAHVGFLADDLLEGRGTATRGHEIAARYVAAQFEALGLEPAGTGGTWFQKVPMREGRARARARARSP